MVHLPISGPDPAKPGSASASGLDAPPEAESDLAGLAARISALSGSCLPNQLSTDLALEIILNQIVEQARSATGATDAAILLERDRELVCRASTGANAPQLGVQLDTEAGLSGACVKTRQMQRCDDVQSDPRVEVKASRCLGIRSVMILPLLWNNDLVGVFEVFSSRPSAFGERDERTLEMLAQRALKNLQQASERRLTGVPDASPSVAPPQECDVAERETRRNESADVYPDLASPNGGRQPDGVTIALGVFVLVCAFLLSVLVGVHWARHRATAEYTHKPKSANTIASRTEQQNTSSSNAGASALLMAVGNSASADSLPVVGTSAMSRPKVGAAAAPPRPRSAVATPPPGSLLIYENGKEIFRKLPSAPGEKQNAKGGEVEHSSPVEPARALALLPDVAGSILLHRVEPQYPEEARRQGIQGPVVLDLYIGKDGTVQDVGLVSGQVVLANAATSAVKQWRFKPHYADGQEVEIQTRITLRFTIPTP
jgi:TonB family protein